MNRPGKYRTLARLARGTEFHLSAMPADTKSWKVLRHMAEGTTMVERQHEDKTLKVQYPTSQLMVFVPDHDLTKQPEEDPMDKQLTMAQLRAEREASQERQGDENPTRTRNIVSKPMGEDGTPKQALGDGGFLKLPTHTEEG